MAAGVLAWESHSKRSVGWPAAARQAERFTAVVVLPTPPVWLATAMIRATEPTLSENLANEGFGCKMFHVEQFAGAVEKLEAPRRRLGELRRIAVPWGTQDYSPLP